MKTQLLVILLATVFSTAAFAANNQRPVKVQTASSAIGAGFESWAKDVEKYDGSGGQVLAAEVQAWVQQSKQIK